MRLPCQVKYPHACRMGFTLIEMLAVILILTTAASLSIVGLASADQAGAMHTAMWQLRAIDAQARARACSQDQAQMIRVAPEGTRMTIQALSFSPVNSKSEEFPNGISVHVFTAGSGSHDPLQSVVVDRQGRTGDLYVEIQGDAGLSRAMNVYGLSGQFVRIDDRDGTNP